MMTLETLEEETGGRDQEDHSSKPARGNSCETLSRKNTSQKRAGGVAQGVGLEFKPQYHKKKKKKRRRRRETQAGTLALSHVTSSPCYD
jgi:hypothetical protein